MNFEKPFEKNKVASAKISDEQIRRTIGGTYNNQDLEGSLAQLGSILKFLLDPEILDEEEIVRIENDLQAIREVKNEADFIEQAMVAIKPLETLAKENPVGYEKLLRKVFVEKNKWIKLSEILSYGKYKDMVHLHLAPARTIENKEKRKMIIEGLKALAIIVAQEEDIERIVATSPLVTRAKTIMEKLGFEIKGKISEETRQRYWSEETNDVTKAEMTRQKLLQIYFKKP